MRAALDVHRELLSRDVPHEVVRLPGAVVATADDLPGALGVAAGACVAVRCYVTDVGFAAVAVPAGTVPDAGSVRSALGARLLRAATADETNAATDYTAGLVSPLCLPPGVALLADTALCAYDVLYCPVGEAGLVVGLRSPDLLRASGARPVQLSPLPRPRTAPEGARLPDRDARSGSRGVP